MNHQVCRTDIVNHEEPDWILIVTTEDGELVGGGSGDAGEFSPQHPQPAPPSEQRGHLGRWVATSNIDET
jgi:hypothetical protein